MGDPNPDSFVKVMLPFLADPGLSDAEKIGLLGLGSWAWDKDHCWPTNAQLAHRCGWLVDGKPSILKAKRTLRRLEKKGRIRRVVVVTDGVPSRPRIELIPPAIDPGSNPTPGGSIMTLPRINNDPTPGQNGPAPRVKSDPTPGRNGTVPGSRVTHNIDSRTDHGRDSLQQTPSTAPPTAAAGVGVALAALAGAPAGDFLGTLMVILRWVAERGDTISLEDLEVIADQIDQMLGLGPGMSYPATHRNRRKLYLQVLQAVANGYSLDRVEGSITTYQATYSRCRRPGDEDRRNLLFFEDMRASLRKLWEWSSVRKSSGKGFRAILPKMTTYRAKGG
jgi:hypothetical protein